MNVLKNGTPVISIIMPVYNTEKWLNESIDSVLSQTFHDFELICVDDSSVDTSFSIIKQYEKKDQRVCGVKIPHGGQGAARNEGIRRAKGEYIYFLDSDDRLKQNALDSMLSYCRKENADIFMFDGDMFFDGVDDEQRKKQINEYKRNKSYDNVVTGEKLYTTMFREGAFTVQPCLMLINKAFLDNSGILFAEGYIYEDNLFTTTLLLKAQRAFHCGIPLYERRIRPDSTVTHQKGVYDYASYFYIWAKMVAFMLNNIYAEETEKAYYEQCCSIREAAVQCAKKLNADEIRQYIHRMGSILEDLHTYHFAPLTIENGENAIVISPFNADAEAIRNSWAFKIGKTITFIPHIIKEMFKR